MLRDQSAAVVSSRPSAIGELLLPIAGGFLLGSFRAERGEEEYGHAEDDGDVGGVEDRPLPKRPELEVQEVDDVTCGQAIEEGSGGAAKDEPASQRRGACGRSLQE